MPPLATLAKGQKKLTAMACSRSCWNVVSPARTLGETDKVKPGVYPTPTSIRSNSNPSLCLPAG